MEESGAPKKVLMDLASRRGAYIIVSGKDDCSGKMLSERLAGMKEAVAALPDADKLRVDFTGEIDCTRGFEDTQESRFGCAPASESHWQAGGLLNDGRALPQASTTSSWLTTTRASLPPTTETWSPCWRVCISRGIDFANLEAPFALWGYPA